MKQVLDHIRPVVVLSLFLLLSYTSVSAQVNMDLYQPATIVTAAGETLHVQIRKVSPDKMAKSITILSEDSMETKKLTAKELVSVQIGDEIYVTQPYDGKKYLMNRVIDGTASLYELTLKEKKGNKSELVTRYFAEKKEENRFVEVTKKDFRKTMTAFVSDYEELARKVDDKYYTYTEKEAVIEDYNEWVKQGKPGKVWRKEDGNFTRPEKEYNNETNNQRPPKIRREYENHRWGIDIPLMGTYCFANYPDILNYAGVITKNGGFGYAVGLGARFDATPSIILRGGLMFRQKGFTSFYQAYDPDTNLYNVEETGTIHYGGIYLMAHYESRSLILGGGFDFSFFNIYRGKYRITDMNGNIHNGNQDESQSIIAPDGFNMQFDFTFNMGYKINLMEDRLRLKPVFQYTIPLVTMFDVDIPSTPPQQAGISGFLIQVGIIADIGFKKKQKRVSLEDLD